MAKRKRKRRLNIRPIILLLLIIGIMDCGISGIRLALSSNKVNKLETKVAEKSKEITTLTNKNKELENNISIGNKELSDYMEILTIGDEVIVPGGIKND